MRKRAQIQLSFGMIFSMIIIVCTLGIAGYLIYQFVNTTDNIECKTFYNELNSKIQSMRSKDAQQSNVFNYEVPSKVDKVCFGNINQTALTEEDRKTQDEIKNYADFKSNLFFTPRGSCGEGSFRYALSYVTSDNFFCSVVKDGKASVRLSIGVADRNVKMSK